MIAYRDVFDVLSYDAQRAIEDYWEDAVDEAESNATINTVYLVNKVESFDPYEDAWRIHNDLGHPGRVDMCNETTCNRQVIIDMISDLINYVECEC